MSPVYLTTTFEVLDSGYAGQTPLKMGVDVVMHYCSKYMSGNSEIIMGASMTSNDEIYEAIEFNQSALGITPSAQDCAMMMRRLKTPEIRVGQQTSNAMKIAQNHPQHELSATQCSGSGALLSMYTKIKNGNEPYKLMRTVRILHPTESLGCVCSLVEIPALMSHSSVPENSRMKFGITNK